MEPYFFNAARGGRVESMLNLLRDYPRIDVNWRDKEDHYTALHIAASNGDVKVVKLLLAHPLINVNVKNKHGQTPFLLGCLKGSSVSAVRELLRDARVDVKLQDEDGRTPLWNMVQLKEVVNNFHSSIELDQRRSS